MPDNVDATAERSQRPVWLGRDRRGWDHVRIHIQLLRDERLTAYHLAVYLGVAAHAELASGRAFPSASTLARYAGIGDRKVRECLHDLEQWHYLTIERREGAASVYTLLAPPPLQDVQGSTGSAAPEAEDPLHHTPGTPARGDDEQEPGTRSNNQRRRPTDAKAPVVGAGSSAVDEPDRRKANPCRQCDGDKLVDALGGTVVQCPRCQGSGIEPSRRVS